MRTFLDACDNISITKSLNDETTFSHATKSLSKRKYRNVISRIRINSNTTDQTQMNRKYLARMKAQRMLWYRPKALVLLNTIATSIAF
jgi:hypothetical protein